MSTRNDLTTAPSTVLSFEQLDELELLLAGFYGSRRAYTLPGQPVSEDGIACQLEVSSAVADSAVRSSTLLLTDADGTTLARLTVEATSPGNDSGRVFVAGSVFPDRPAEHPPARSLRITRPLARSKTSQPVVAAFSEIPRPEEVAAAIASARGSELVLIALQDSLAGRTPGFYAVIESLQKCSDVVPNCRTGVLIVPSFSSPCGTRGTTRARAVLEHLGAETILEYLGKERPDSVALARSTSLRPGTVVLFTGLSGSGKSTLARALAERLLITNRRDVTLLDGDEVRRILSTELGFSREDREINVERIGWVASRISKASGVAICAPIAPFDTTRQRVRHLAEEVGHFVLVHVSTPLAVCEARDRKGLYAKARAGLVANFTGIDSPFEAPQDADLVIDTSLTTIDEAMELLLPLVEH